MVNLSYIKKAQKRITKKVRKLEKSIFESKFYRHWQHSYKGKVNLNSNLQLSNFLYNVKKIKPLKLTESGKGGTDEEALKMLKIPELDMILQRSKYLKLRDTYLKAFEREQVGGLLHPFFNLHIARTYRSSSTNPNFQNIPKRGKDSAIVRKAITARPGHQLLEMDYSAIEVGVAATYHKDPTMIKYLEEGFDMHGDMAAQIFKIKDFDKHRKDHAFLRSCVKNSFVFPQFYGDYYKNCASNIVGNWVGLPHAKWKKGMGYEMLDGSTIADHLIKVGLKDYQSFEDHIKQIEHHFWSKRFPVYAKWKEKHYKQYLKTGHVNLHTGFACQGVMSKNDAINYPVQGAAFHCLLWLFIELTKELEERKMNTRLVGQIHDAVVLDVDPKELEKVYWIIQELGTQKIKEAFKWINIPLAIEAELCPVDGSWADKEEWQPEKPF